MKTKLNILIIAFIVLLFSNKLFAQSNLQFNKVIYKNFVGTTGGGSNTIVDTLIINVDSDKVVKIESAAANLTSNSIGSDFTSNAAITLDNVVISAASYSNNPMPRNVFPIWLPKGTYKIALICPTASASSGYISAIEYNLIH